jgi:hypothetical protein
MPFRLPAGLIAIVVGTFVGFFAGASKIDFPESRFMYRFRYWEI